MELLFSDPIESEAFPGLLFGLTTNRDQITIIAADPAQKAQHKLLSLDRRGYIVRHPINATFTAIPPRDSGLLPIHRPEGLPSRRPLANETFHPSIGNRFRFRDHGSLLLLETYLSSQGHWETIAAITATGELYPWRISPAAARAMTRHEGLQTTALPSGHYTITLTDSSSGSPAALGAQPQGGGEGDTPGVGDPSTWGIDPRVLQEPIGQEAMDDADALDDIEPFDHDDDDHDDEEPEED